MVLSIYYESFSLILKLGGWYFTSLNFSTLISATFVPNNFELILSFLSVESVLLRLAATCGYLFIIDIVNIMIIV
jgi:hypothetical protein